MKQAFSMISLIGLAVITKVDKWRDSIFGVDLTTKELSPISSPFTRPTLICSIKCTLALAWENPLLMELW